MKKLESEMYDQIEVLTELALSFRLAIEKCDWQLLGIPFDRFPRGSCGDTTLLLAEFFKANRLEGFVHKCGMRGIQSHAWLQRGRLIVDITADQFEDQPNSVIVSSNSVWHDQFCDEVEETTANYRFYDERTKEHIDRCYKLVMEHI